MLEPEIDQGSRVRGGLIKDGDKGGALRLEATACVIGLVRHHRNVPQSVVA